MQSTRSRFDQILTNDAFIRLLGRHRTVGKYKTCATVRRQVMDHMLYPGKVGISLGRNAVLPALVFGESFTTPVRNIEWRIGQDEICFQVGMAIIVESCRREQSVPQCRVWPGSSLLDARLYSSTPVRRLKYRL